MALSAKENKIDVRLFELIIISLTNVVQQLPVEHDIFRLQVPIDDPSLVEMLQCQQHLFRGCKLTTNNGDYTKDIVETWVCFDNNEIGLVMLRCELHFVMGELHEVHGLC